MAKNTYSDDLQRVFKSQILSPSPLIREENNPIYFFTHSRSIRALSREQTRIIYQRTSLFPKCLPC